MEKGALQREKGENQEQGQKPQEKETIFPNSQTLSQQGSVGPIVIGASGPERQVIDLEMLVVAMTSEMETSRPSRDAGVNAKNAAFLIGPAGEPLEMSPRVSPIELQTARINLVVRLWGTMVEL